MDKLEAAYSTYYVLPCSQQRPDAHDDLARPYSDELFPPTSLLWRHFSIVSAVSTILRTLACGSSALRTFR
jgi:hypothetical protein